MSQGLREVLRPKPTIVITVAPVLVRVLRRTGAMKYNKPSKDRRLNSTVETLRNTGDGMKSPHMMLLLMVQVRGSATQLDAQGLATEMIRHVALCAHIFSHFPEDMVFSVNLGAGRSLVSYPDATL